jgi:hypothetical protein
MKEGRILRKEGRKEGRKDIKEEAARVVPCQPFPRRTERSVSRSIVGPSVGYQSIRE